MEKIRFSFGETGETAEFFVLEQTRINGMNYILVTDSEEDDAEAYISPWEIWKTTRRPMRGKPVSRLFSELNPDLLCISAPSPGIKENRKKRFRN